MKRRAQRRLRQGYEERRGGFDSFVDFINRTADESEFVREMVEKFGGSAGGEAKS